MNLYKGAEKNILSRLCGFGVLGQKYKPDGMSSEEMIRTIGLGSREQIR